MEKFCILKNHISKQNFISRYSNELLWSHDNNEADVYIEANVITQKIDKLLYQVDLMVNINVVTYITQKSAYDIDIIYTSTVFINNSVNEKDVDKILMVDVPTETYQNVRDIVKQLTENSGFNKLSIDPIDFRSRYKQRRYVVDIE